MPCNSDYLKPSQREAEIQRAAMLLVWASSKLGIKPKKWAVKTADDIYANDERVIPTLCELVKGMTTDQREKIIYDAKNKMSRALADWWETHQEADRRREQREQDEKERAALRASALAKLSRAECDALGIGCPTKARQRAAK